jgi:quercetin dioxygenase-like cupin family protein
MDREQRRAIQPLEGGGGGRCDFGVAVQDGPFHGEIIALALNGICSGTMSTQTVRLHRWDEIALEKVTEMLSRKIVTGDREMLAQIYLKRGCLVPMHSHESEQMTYILQGALKFLIGGEEITVREGEVLHIPSWVEHQAEALEDTFELDVFSPIRQDWLDHTDDYFRR